MGNTLGCLALVLAASGPAAPNAAKPEITYQFQMVEALGLSWRAPGETGLTPVAHHGAVSVWTAPGDFIESMPNDARGAVAAESSVHGPALSPTHLTTRKEQAFVTKVSWKGKDRTLKQTTENVREGIAATVVGRKLDQGVLVKLVIDDTDIRSVHTIPVPGPRQAYNATRPLSGTSVAVTASMDAGCCSETIADVDGQEAECAGECPFSATVADRDQDCEISQSEWLPSKGQAKSDFHTARAGYTDATAGAEIQLPEIGFASAAGEWLIPDGGVLVIGFGPHTVADAEGRAVVREHLAVITAETDEDEGEVSDSDALAPPPPMPAESPSKPARATSPALDPSPAPRTAAAIPGLPSRTLPQGVHADGTPSVLPPLPDEEKEAAPAGDSKSDEPLPSPQSKRNAKPAAEAVPPPLPHLPIPEPEPKAPIKKVSHTAAKTAFSLPQLSQLAQIKPSSLLPFPLPGAQFLLPLKAFGIKLPFNQKLEFELLGRIVPDLDAAAEEQVVAVGR